VGQPIDLAIADEAAVEWRGGGLAVKSPTIIASAGPARKLIEACRESNAITVEAWVKPANTTQAGPARIVTLSADTGRRNFTLGQAETSYVQRLRTTSTSDNGMPELTSPGGAVRAETTHVVYTREPSGRACLYVNGEERLATIVGGALSNWSDEFRLALANELTGDRPWLGEYYLVAIYSRALTPLEVADNHEAGARPE
jgi:hypothetical protein